MLQYNVISYWLGTCTAWSLPLHLMQWTKVNNMIIWNRTPIKQFPVFGLTPVSSHRQAPSWSPSSRQAFQVTFCCAEQFSAGFECWNPFHSQLCVWGLSVLGLPRLGNCSLWHGLISPQSGSILSLGYPELTSGLSMAHSSLVASGSTTGFSGNLSSNFCRMAAMKLFLILSRFCLPWRTWLPLNSSFAPDTVKCSLRSWCIWVCCEGSRDCRLDNAHLQCSTWTSTMLIGVGGAVRFLVVGTIGKEETPRVSSGWSSVWHCSNTGLSSTQYEQIPIILGVWPFWLTPFFFRSITFWWDYGWIVFPLVKLLSFFWLTYYCSIGLCFSGRV